eukprot:g898.t1
MAAEKMDWKLYKLLKKLGCDPAIADRRGVVPADLKESYALQLEDIAAEWLTSEEEEGESESGEGEQEEGGEETGEEEGEGGAEDEGEEEEETGGGRDPEVEPSEEKEPEASDEKETPQSQQGGASSSSIRAGLGTDLRSQPKKVPRFIECTSVHRVRASVNMPYFSRTLGLVQLLLLGQSPHHAVRASKSDGLEVTAVDDIPYHALSPQETVHLLTQYAGLALPIHFEEGGQLGLQKHLDLAIPTSASVSKGENEKGKAQKTQVATGGDEQSSYDGPNLPELQQALETERTAFYLTGLPGGSTVGPSHRKVVAYQTAAERGETVAKLLKHLIGEDHDGGAPAQEVDRSTRPTIAGLNDPATVLLEKARNVRLLYEPDSRSYSQTALHAAMSPKAGEFYVYKGDEADEQSAAENEDNEEQEQVHDVVYIGNNATTFEYMLDFIMKNDLDLLTAVNSPGGSSPTKVAALANGSGTIAAGSASVSVEGTTVQSFQRLETAVGGHTQQLLRLDGRHSLLKFAAENAIFTRNENVPAHVNEEADYLQIVKLLLKKYYPENAQDLQSFAKASSYFDETWSWESQKDRGWNKNAIQRPEKQAKLEQDYHFYQQFSSKYLEAKNLGDEPVISKSSMSYFVDGEQSFLEWVLVKCSESLPVEEKAEQVEGENAEGLDGEGEEEDEHQGTTGADAAAASTSEEAVDKTLQMSKPCDFLIPELLRRGATVKNVLPTAVRDANLAGYLPALLTSMMRSYGNEPKQIQELHQDLRASYNDDGETLLHFAVEADNLEAIKLLLQFDDGISSAHGRDEDAAWSRLKKTVRGEIGSDLSQQNQVNQIRSEMGSGQEVAGSGQMGSGLDLGSGRPGIRSGSRSGQWSLEEEELGPWIVEHVRGTKESVCLWVQE